MIELYINNSFKIQPLTTLDAPALYGFLASNENELRRFFPITLEKNKTLKATENYILDKSKEVKLKKEYTFAVKNNNTPIGLLILKNLNWELKRGEIAYCIDKSFQGRGLITEALKKVTAFAFNDLSLKTLEIIVYSENKASVRVAEKCGYKWTRTLLKAFSPGNEEPLDMELYERSNEK